MDLEYAVLKVPSEHMVKNFRATKKSVDKEVEFALSVVQELAGNDSTADVSQLETKIKSSISKLQSLKSKLDELHSKEDSTVDSIQMRIKHLQQQAEYASAKASALSSAFSTPMTTNTNDDDPVQVSMHESDVVSNQMGTNAMLWSRVRLNRILVDYLMREGMFESAQSLARCTHVEQLVDLDVFLSSRRVIEALQRGECAEALKWCSENRRRLAKIGSSLEFRLRIQEFVELQRSGKRMEAIAYARKNIVPIGTEYFDELKQAVALLAFESTTLCEPYASIFSKARWNDLIEQFKSDNYSLHGLTNEALLSILLKAGISSLKTQYCFNQEFHEINCPTCNEPFNSLAENLPFSLHVHSVLVCRISGTIMNEHNPPLALPNGNVYSKSALDQLALHSGIVTDPKTGEAFMYPSREIRKVFIM